MPESNSEEIRQQLKEAISAWPQQRIVIALAAMQDAVALAIDRIINRGENSRGGIFGEYADSTKRRKQSSGRAQPSFPNINFSDTNRMWRTTQARVLSTTKTEITLVIEPFDNNRREVFGYHEERFADDNGGSIVALNDEEELIIIEDYQDAYIDYLTKYIQ